MDTTNDEKRSFFRRYRWLLAGLLLIGVGGGYLYVQRGGSLDLAGSFTRYRQFPARDGATSPLSPDSLADIPPVKMADTLPPYTNFSDKTPDSFLGFALPVYDSLPPIYADSAVVDSAAIADSIARTAGGALSDTMTPAPESPLAVTPAPSPTSAREVAEDIFDGLLPATYQSPAAEKTFLANYNSRAISTRGTYKLVAIAGKAFLLHESPEVLEMLNTFVDEEAIVAISVSDRTGRILYASNPRERGRMVEDVYANLSVTNEAMNWMRTDGRTVTGIPVFSVGGRLGTVFIATR